MSKIHSTEKPGFTVSPNTLDYAALAMQIDWSRIPKNDNRISDFVTGSERSKLFDELRLQCNTQRTPR